MLAIDYSKEARTDLAQIWFWIAEHASVKVADRHKTKIEDKVTGLLAKHPGIGRTRPEFGSAVRSFPIPPYVVFYRHAGRRVEVLRVLHGYQDIREPLMSLLTAV